MADQQQQGSLLNSLALIDPNTQDLINQMQIQRRLDLANALVAQGEEPMPGTSMAGQVAVRNSPLQGLAKILAIGGGLSAGNKLISQSGQNQADIINNAAGSFRGSGIQSDQEDPNAPGSQSMTAGHGAFENVSDRQMLAAFLAPGGPTSLVKAATDYTMQQRKPTEATQLAEQAGGDTAAVQAANWAALQKANSNLHMRNGLVTDMTTGKLVAYFPALAEGATYSLQNPGAPLSATNQPVGEQPFPGANQAFQGAAFANASGAAGGAIGQYSLNGKSNVPMYGVNAAGGLPKLPNWSGGAPPPAPGMPPPQTGDAPQGGPQGAPPAMPQGAPQGAAPQAAPPPVKLPPPTSPTTGFGIPSPPLQGQIDAVRTQWTAQQTANSNAQSVIGLAQQIKTLAPMAAAGRLSDKVDLANNLLAMAGVSGRAKDAVSATDLLNTYSNQIITTLGGGPAAQQVVQAAVPGKIMDPQAISDAADLMIGAQRMVQAKTALLAPYAQANDPQYQAIASQYDKVADPRAYVWKNMPPGDARKTYAQKLMTQEPTMHQRISTLEGWGAL